VRHTGVFAAAARARAHLAVDSAVLASLCNRLLVLLAGPLTLLFVAVRLSGAEQGFYYTFASIVALAQFLELGLGYIITQFISHESARLRCDPDGRLHGSLPEKHRALDILRMATRWYVLVALIGAVVLGPLGLRFFHDEGLRSGVRFTAPWLITVLATAMNLCAIPLWSALEGMGWIARVQWIRFAQTLGNVLALWISLGLGAGLFAPAIAAVTTELVTIASALLLFPGLLRQLGLVMFASPRSNFSWRHEALPTQWRMALSWMAGYLVYSLLTPTVFRTRGAVYAGKVGMSLSVANASYVIAMAWVNTRAPRYGSLIRAGKLRELAVLWRDGLVRALGAWAVGSLFTLGVVAVLQAAGTRLGDRLLSLPLIALLLAANGATLVMQAMALLLRARKTEPLLGVSIVFASITATLVVVAAVFISAPAAVTAYGVTVLLIGLPTTYLVFSRERRDVLRLRQS
jgi:hypothetical protein